MKPDSMLVEPDHVSTARQEVASAGVIESLRMVGEAEPALALFIQESLATAAGKLALSGAPTEVVHGSHEESLAIILTCIQAMRRGHFDLWKDSLTGTRLAQFDPQLAAKPNRRRTRKPKGDAAGQGPA